MTETVLDASILTAFLAGIVAFLSPCVLPLMPGYLSIVTRLSYDELVESENISKFSTIFIPSLVFVLGFSTVFVSLGAFSSQIGIFISANKALILKIIGVLIILFGLFTMELVRFGWLNRERRLDYSQQNKGGLAGNYLLGIAFGFGWTPCVGPILASILLYASTAEGSFKGPLLLFVYSIGLGIPFILTGLAFYKALNTFKLIRRYYSYYKYIVGGTLIIVGILMFTNSIFQLNIYGQKILGFLGIDFWKSF